MRNYNLKFIENGKIKREEILAIMFLVAIVRQKGYGIF